MGHNFERERNSDSMAEYEARRPEIVGKVLLQIKNYGEGMMPHRELMISLPNFDPLWIGQALNQLNDEHKIKLFPNQSNRIQGALYKFLKE